MGRKISEGKSVKATVPENTTIEQGKFYLLDGFLGLAVQSVTTGADETSSVVLSFDVGEYETSQIDAADAFAAGDKVYWDDANKRLTTVATDGFFCGIVTQAKDANNVIWLWFAPQQAALLQAATVAAVATADVTEVASADGAAAEGANPTKAEFDAVVTLVNENKDITNSLVALGNANKAAINAILTALKAAKLMA